MNEQEDKQAEEEEESKEKKRKRKRWGDNALKRAVCARCSLQPISLQDKENQLTLRI